MVRITLPALLVLILLAPAPALTQWLGPHLDAQRWGRLNKHQQKMKRRNLEKRRAAAARNAQSKDDSTSKPAKPEPRAANSRAEHPANEAKKN